MGSCCSVERAPTAGADEAKGGTYAYAAAGGDLANVKVSGDAMKAFKALLSQSIPIVVLLSEGTRLACVLKYDAVKRDLLIYCDSNYREVPLVDVLEVLHTESELRRVETAAAIVGDKCIAALHLRNGNCIPIRFETAEQKFCFIKFLKEKS